MEATSREVYSMTSFSDQLPGPGQVSRHRQFAKDSFFDARLQAIHFLHTDSLAKLRQILGACCDPLWVHFYRPTIALYTSTAAVLNSFRCFLGIIDILLTIERVKRVELLRERGPEAL